MKLTKNFSLSEFECKCDCTMDDEVLSNIKELAANLQVLRDFVKRPIKLTNAYRCLSHNRSIGSKDTSQHVKGKAADIKIEGMTPEEVYKTIQILIAVEAMKEGGLSPYGTFTHYDTRGYKARW